MQPYASILQALLWSCSELAVSSLENAIKQVCLRYFLHVGSPTSRLQNSRWKPTCEAEQITESLLLLITGKGIRQLWDPTYMLIYIYIYINMCLQLGRGKSDVRTSRRLHGFISRAWNTSYVELGFHRGLTQQSSRCCNDSAHVQHASRRLSSPPHDVEQPWAGHLLAGNLQA